MTHKGCGTCRDRRILCDRALPTCVQCSKSGRTCQGYGLRLSWPNANDRKRAKVGKLPRARKGGRRVSDPLLVNASSWDIEMHYHLLGLVSDRYTKLVLQAPMPFNPLNLNVREAYLFEYFQCTASRSLTTFGHDPTSVGNLLIRMCLTSNTPSATAVLHSMLALSSLHLYGLQDQAGQLKLSALKALAAASWIDIGPMAAAQHVATGMLLCSFEIHRASCTSGHWRCYIGGVKKIINASSSCLIDPNSDFKVLLDWIYYHDVMSRFSQLHWSSEEDKLIPPACASEYPWANVPPATVFGFDPTIQLLSNVCDAVAARPPPTAPAEKLSEYLSFVNILEWRVRAMPISTPERNGVQRLESAKMTELFQLSMLVYLNKATGNVSEPAIALQQHISRAFKLFSDLAACDRQFPLFVLGCEAETDEERRIVLDLITRTEKSASSRSLFLVTRLIQAIWVQDDLADGELNYMDKLSAMISCCTIMPTFV
ncbi:hypothetical protein P170DRAFT_456280 [Aspergillus steynii IBT 23096]|uniref:Zn(2)-C6 fungal-type domain-containing protein n=1 Tax=Aspergillus steynii IBT 23096 TaxID=1392250 RepID=A0A2I2GA46_9EURO|nr:uncharacterized protein P170DRAFT_456280 [Aspergillus steynii IBT 23096]PLB49745.1 hypothetical protein P170DRAFT_456280 [Aspergillus steynii IBT 23096]